MAEAETRVGLSLGSNLGDPPAHLAAALAALVARDAVRLEAVSSIYRTPPWGPVPQGDFANLCAIAHTRLAPLALLDAAKAVERALGRTPGVRWGPRVIDIDIVFYGDLRLDTPRLTLPHREATRRAFVLVPLAEIAPDLRVAGQPIGDLAAAVDRRGVTAWQASAR